MPLPRRSARDSRLVWSALACLLTVACEGSPAAPEADAPVGQALAGLRPPVPAALTATPHVYSVDLAWPDSPNETRYELGRAPAPGTTIPTAAQYVLVASPGADATAYEDEGVAPKTRYRYRLRACNADGCSGFRYVYVTTLTPPPPPTPGDFAAELDENQDVDLSWSDVDGETQYRLRRTLAPEAGPLGRPAALPVRPADATTFKDPAALYDRRYRYEIQACNVGGCSAYAQLFITLPDPPPPATVPTGFGAGADASLDVVLEWGDASNETRYEIERALAAGTLVSAVTIIATPDAGGTTYTDETAVPGKRYRYRIRSCNGAGCSAWAPLYFVVPLPDPPEPPGAFEGIVNEETGDVELEWTDVDAETFYKIQRTLAPEGGSLGAPVTFPNRPANTTDFADASAAAGKRYRYWLFACNEGGCSTPPLETFLVTPGPGIAPTGFAGTAESDGDVVLTWHDAPNETSYSIDRALAPSGTTIQGGVTGIANPEAGATTHTDETAVLSRRYRYRIRACNGFGCSAYVTIYVVAAPAAPATPASFVADPSVALVELTWSDVPDEDSYEIERALAPTNTTLSGNVLIATRDPDVLTYADEEVSAARYRYRIRACNEVGCSSYRTIYVRVPEIASVDVAPRAKTLLAATQTHDFNATVWDSNGNEAPEQAVTWSSSDTDVATIDPVTGLATALGPGTTTVTARAGTVEGTATLTVRDGTVVGDLVLLPDWGNVEDNDYVIDGFFAVWWDRQNDFEAGATAIAARMNQVRSAALALGMRDPPNPAAGVYVNIYIHVPGAGNDNYPADWGNGVGRNAEQLPHMAIPSGFHTDAANHWHEGFHLYQFSMTSPGFEYAGDGSWYTEASANWFMSRALPAGEATFGGSGAIVANPQQTLWHGWFNAPPGDPSNWQRDTRQYALVAWLHYLTAVRGVAPTVITDGFYAGTAQLPQEYLFGRIPGLRALFGDWAVHSTAEMDYISRAQWQYAEDEIGRYGDPEDLNPHVAQLGSAGTNGAWIEPPSALAPRGWSYNVVRMTTSNPGGTYTFQLDGAPTGSAGGAARFEARVLVRTSSGDAFHTVPLPNGLDGSLALPLSAGAEVFFVIAAVPDHFRGHQSYPYRLSISHQPPLD